MIAAGDVVKFIAKVAIAIIEVDMKKKFGEGDGPDESHAGRKTTTFVRGLALEGCR